jgi:SPX domain protein involved in polyphosphate accumulation
MDARYELKFVLPLSEKERLLELIAPNLYADKNGDNACYRISSIYFDTSDRKYYWEKVDGIEIRKKVRLRFYHSVDDQHLENPRAYFLEIKRRYNNSILKERIKLNRDNALVLIKDEQAFNQLSELYKPSNENDQRSLINLETIYHQDHLQSSNIITYIREAWMGKWDEKLRITFDSFVQAYQPWQLENIRENSGAPLIPHTFMIMELKFDSAVPVWLRDVIVKLGYTQQRFSKYAHGVEQLYFNKDLSSRLTF